ncbi:MAG: hypothetical protein HC875_16955 [Anaerolineales bacterium]|nr:hypothetical protein [Anaerolineales bacterium]
MYTFTIFMLVIVPMVWTAWKIYQARRAILTAAKQQADLMEDMPITEAARFSLLGKNDVQPIPDQLPELYLESPGHR